MSVILNQFPDPVMKKHKSPSYTQQDYDVVDFMNNYSLSNPHLSISNYYDNYLTNKKGAEYLKIPINSEQYGSSFDFTGTKIHVKESNFRFTAETSGSITCKSSTMGTKKTIYPYSFEKLPVYSYISTGGSKYTINEYTIFRESTSNGVYVDTTNTSVDTLISGSSSFKLSMKSGSGELELSGTIPSSGYTISGGITVKIEGIRILLHIDYVILSTGERINNGQTIK